ncbi:MAG: DUF6772 family protein [Candidatus Solibacter sp.]
MSRYNPLPRILTYDDFDEGINGWCELIGNHDGNLDNVREITADLRPPQLSNCSFFDIGTHGSMSGTYALKLATRARPMHMAQAIKRLTFVERGLVRFETYFTYKAEQVFRNVAESVPEWDGNVDPSEKQFGDFTISNDVCEGDDGVRYHCALRYLNTDQEGHLRQTWMYKTSVQPTTKMVRSGLAAPNQDYHVVDPSDWKEVPGGHQPLCYNEMPTKINWHYLRWEFDTRTRRNAELQVNNNIMDLSQIPVPVFEHRYKALDQLLNFCIDVRTHRAVRNFLYLDSVVISVDW